ncbi:hypothetical protein PTQ19_00915 [Microbacterium esteraromaticum]|uniref:hypothetical protein n=1 Tax=Microbacterium esteraromaticum TaxID=57043 RepID=UPI00236884B3|nr:hypothetical protein [Microbacterium esteraromaticum]WDH79034.1 hypothetical protein PTQ19_00915 [Microbacterium esteraromaticum]
MNIKNTMMRAGGALALGAVLALAGAQAAGATEHEATTSEGVAEVRIAFGTEFAGATTTVLVLDADADPHAPAQGDIAYVAEVVADAEGTAAFRAALPAGLNYWLASTPAEGERYVAMLDGSAGGGDGGDGSGGDGDGSGGDGDGSGGEGDGSGGDGSGGDGEGNGSDGDADGSDAGGDGSDAGAEGDLATTGQAAWLLPLGIVLAGGLITTGAVLYRRRSVD